MYRIAFLFVLLINPIFALAEGMPCESLKSEISQVVGYYYDSEKTDFLNCIKQKRVCVIANDQTIGSDTINETPREQPAYYAIVQSPPDNNDPVCLISQYSGDSAASWLFYAFSTKNGLVTRFRGMHKANAYGNTFDAKSAAFMTYKMFDKYAEH